MLAKMKSFLLSALAAASVCSTVAATDTIGYNERGGVKAGDISFGITYFLPGWSARSQDFKWHRKMFKSGTPVDKNGELSLETETDIAELPSSRIVTTLKKIPLSGTDYTAKVKFISPAKLEAMALTTTLPFKKVANRSFAIDGKSYKFPEKFNKTSLFHGKAKSLKLAFADGEISIDGDFEILIQDNRKWKHDDFSIRFYFADSSGDNITELSFACRFNYTPYAATPLDLSKAVNMGFRDKKENDEKGGWTDQGADNDLRMLPVGKQRFGGVDFNIIDPAKNNGKSCIVLNGTARNYFPVQTAAEQSSRVRGKYLYLLHAASFCTRSASIGNITLKYADGTSQKIDIIRGRDIDNWWAPFNRKNAEVVWTGENSSSYIGLYRSCFAIQEKQIKSIIFNSNKESVWGIVAASVSNTAVPRAEKPPFYVIAGREYKPISFDKKTVIRGSALDFSSTLDAPAGKYGKLIVKNGKFVFEKRPDIPVRFYGTNLCSTAPFVSKEWSERLADILASFGFNAVRLHHHDGRFAAADDSTKMEESALNQMEYLIYALKKRGIYVTVDLYVSRLPFVKEIKGYPGSGKITDITVFKALFWIDDSARDNLFAYLRNYFSHRNPYTGLKITEEPSLLFVSIINEGNIKSCWNANTYTRKLYEDAFAEWQRNNNRFTKTARQRELDFGDFLAELYHRRQNETVKFLRDNGLNTPLADQNMSTYMHLTQMRNRFDYVDNHGYYDHPSWTEKSWQLPSRLHNESAVKRYAHLPASLMPTRIYGKPFVLSEWDYCYPNIYRAEGPFIMSAYSALQNWDALFQFGYSHRKEYYMEPAHIKSFFDIAVDPVKHLAHRISAGLFLNNRISPAKAAYTFRLNETDRLAPDDNYPQDLQRLGLVSRLGSSFGILPNGNRAVFARKDSNVNGAITENRRLLEAALNAGKADSKNMDIKAGRFISDTGEIMLDAKAETFSLTVAQNETFILPAGKTLTGNFLSVRNRIERGVFSIQTLDQKKLSDSGRMLLLHLTHTYSTKTKFKDDSRTQMESYGTLPILAARGEAELELAGTGYRIYAIDLAGKRLSEISVRVKNGKSLFPVKVFNSFGQIFAYEIERAEY